MVKLLLLHHREHPEQRQDSLLLEMFCPRQNICAAEGVENHPEHFWRPISFYRGDLLEVLIRRAKTLKKDPYHQHTCCLSSGLWEALQSPLHHFVRTFIDRRHCPVAWAMMKLLLKRESAEFMSVFRAAKSSPRATINLQHKTAYKLSL